MGTLVGFVVALALLCAAQASRAEPIKLPRVCLALANNYGFTVQGDTMDRADIERHLNDPDVIAIGAFIPEVNRCREALKAKLK